MTVLLLFAFPIYAQHLRIFACAIANDSTGASMGGSSNGSGLYQSDDTGKTWKHLGWDNIKCYSMDMVQSSNGRILYEATGLGILHSTDYGEHWKQITDWRISEAMDVAVNQKNPNEIYIATAHGPWRSEDGGKTWEALLEGLPVPYTCRIVIDSVIPNHVLVASEAGIFALWNDTWIIIPCEQKNIRNEKEKTPTEIRFIDQLSQDIWLAASENSRELISSDSAKSFGTPSFGDEGLWTISSISLGRDHDVTAMGGGWGHAISDRNDDEVRQFRDDKIKNVSSILQIPIPYDMGSSSHAMGLYSSPMFGTLGDGIPWNGKSKLFDRQIWTLKSFLVTP